MSQLLPRYLGWLATTLSALFLVACAASGITYNPAPSPTANDALVYIYRTDSAAFSARSAYFYVDDVNVADLKRRGYTWFHIAAGEYTVKQKWPFDITLGTKTIQGKARWLPGRTYYYRLQLTQKPFTVEWRFSEVPADEAIRELAECRLQPAFGDRRTRKTNIDEVHGVHIALKKWRQVVISPSAQL